MLLDGVSDRRAEGMFSVTGRENLDAAIAQGKGCIILTSHFGAAHVAGALALSPELSVAFVHGAAP